MPHLREGVEGVMSIIRVSKRERYVTIDKTGIEDASLSFRATGLLAYLLSKPNDWSISYRQLSKVKKDGEHSVREGLKELTESGYLHRERKQFKNGQWGWDQVLYETPNRAAEITARNRAAVFRAGKITALTEEGLTETSLESEASNLQIEPDPLVARMVSVCTGRNVEDEAEQVVSMLRQYVDDRVIDECVGIAAQLEEPPRRPRYFLVSVRDFATRRGVAMPNLRLAS